MTIVIQETKPKYDRMRLEQLALSHIGDIPQLDEPTEEQKQWLRSKGVK